MALWVVFGLYTVLLVCNESYFLSSNPLTQPKAKQFCRDYCSSHLASIHNETEWNRAIGIINNSFNISSPPLFEADININRFDVWIGLEGDKISKMTWTDGTSFDYGTTAGVYPWNENEPSSKDEECVQVWSDQKYVWNDYECSHDMRFLCNSCVGKLEKYILIKQSKNNADAQMFCQTNIGTDLASLHSESDYEEAKYLCQLTEDQSCWIGLTDAETEGVWKWQDGTSLDFGSDISGGKYPWSNFPDSEPNNINNEDCASINQDKSYLINDEQCLSVQMYFLCKMPSELCEKSQWNVDGDLQWLNNKPCNVHSEKSSSSIINDKKWVNGDNEWIIDYMFTVHNTYQPLLGQAGILIYHFDTICDYYFAGIVIDANGSVTLFIDKYSGNVLQQRLFESNALFTYEYNRYYSLRVKLVYSSNSIQWVITINDQSISFTDMSSIAFINHSRRIGIKNENMNITAKSLFASDTPVYYQQTDSISWNRCTLSPSFNPTFHPSFSPSMHPTLVPTDQPSLNPTNHPTMSPSQNPSYSSTVNPTESPNSNPTVLPSANPTFKVTQKPSSQASIPSTQILTLNPTSDPTTFERENWIQTSGTMTTVYAQSSQTTANSDDLEVGNGNLWNTELFIIVMLLFCCVMAVTFGCILFIKKDSDKKKKILKQVMASHKNLPSESDEVIIQNNKVNEVKIKVVEAEGMTRFYVRAITDWQSLENDQLSFSEDEIICIVYTTKSGWWYAIDKQGNDGWIPSNYVIRLSSREDKELKKSKESYNDDEDVIVGLLTPQMDHSYNALQSKQFKFHKLPPTIPPVKFKMMTAGNDSDSSSFDDDENPTLGLNTSF